MGLYKTPVQSDELYHFGTKGMRWGIRRYQNKDGSLTPAGKKRYGSKENFEYHKELNKAKRRVGIIGGIGAAAGAATVGAAAAQGLQYKKAKDYNEPNEKHNILDRDIKTGKGKENKSLAESVLGDAKNSIDSSAQLAGTVSDKYKREMRKVKNPALEREIKSLSTKELNDRINRINAEQRYRDLKTPDIETGAEKAKEILLITGQVVTTAAGIVGIASAIHNWKSPKKGIMS